MVTTLNKFPCNHLELLNLPCPDSTLFPSTRANLRNKNSQKSGCAECQMLPEQRHGHSSPEFIQNQALWLGCIKACVQGEILSNWLHQIFSDIKNCGCRNKYVACSSQISCTDCSFQFLCLISCSKDGMKSLPGAILLLVSTTAYQWRLQSCVLLTEVAANPH